jgi:NAD(P)-dependent dehydrogenase (short-subunit alcohol dehydrogenase family)
MPGAWAEVALITGAVRDLGRSIAFAIAVDGSVAGINDLARNGKVASSLYMSRTLSLNSGA